MPISRASFGLVTQLLDFAAPLGDAQALRVERAEWGLVLEWATALGAGALAEEVTLGDETTVGRFIALQQEARTHGLEIFLRLRELTDEALGTLREMAAAAAAKLAPGETGPPGLRVVVDLGEPDEEDLARWLPRRGGEGIPDFGEEGPGGGWSQALAVSLFAPHGDIALRRLERIASPLLEAARRPGVEQPVWLAAYGVGAPGAEGDPDGVIQVAVHALALGIERVFLADGPISGWWPHHLRTLPLPLQAFRTLTGHLDGASRVIRLAPGQYRIEIPDQRDRYLLWKSPDTPRLPPGLEGPLEVTTPLGEVRRVEGSRLRLTDEPVFVECME